MKLFVFILTVAFATSVYAQDSKKLTSTGFFLEYSSSTKMIRIEGNHLEVTEWIEQYDNPVSSMPSGRKEVVKTAVLSSEELTNLKIFVKQSGFMSLPKDEYGANIEERFYPYSILVRTKGKEKKVLYRSNPSSEIEAAPKAFSALETKLNDLVSQQKNWE